MGTQQDTHKMRSRRGIFIAAFLIAIVVTLLGLVRFIPVDESNFMALSAYTALAEMALGIINFILLPVSSVEPPVFYVLYVAVLLISGFIFGLIIAALWRLGWLGRIMVLVLIAINTCPGMFVVSFSNTSAGPPYATCEANISDQVEIRIKAYPEAGVIPGAHFFSWKPGMRVKHGSKSCAFAMMNNWSLPVKM